jgi:hypothetical protein
VRFRAFLHLYLSFSKVSHERAHPSAMNFAWRRFADVCDVHHQHLDICAPYPSGKWCHSCPGCEHPLHVLHTHPDGLPLPPLHVARQGPFARCFDRWSRPRTDMLFVGDSQTKMLMFELLRWLDGGTLEPSWAMTQSGPLKAGILARAAYSLSRVGALFVGGLYSRGRSKDGTNLTQTAAALREAASSGAGRHAVFIVGVGVWDLVYSSEEDVARSFGLRFPWLLKQVLRAAQSYASAEVVVRNVFTSYTAGAEPVLMPRLAELNEEIGRCFAEATTWARSPTVRLHFVDAYELSWPRRGEMPNGGDGLHWACTSEHQEHSGEPHRRPSSNLPANASRTSAGWQVVENS